MSGEDSNKEISRKRKDLSSMNEIQKLRVSAGFTQAQCAKIFGIELGGWQKKEIVGTKNSRGITHGELQFLRLLADLHPTHQLKSKVEINDVVDSLTITNLICGDEVKRLRVAAGLTQAKCAAQFGIGIRSWQKKEVDGTKSSRSITVGEFSYLLLLADEHPTYQLVEKSGNATNKEVIE